MGGANGDGAAAEEQTKAAEGAAKPAGSRRKRGAQSRAEAVAAVEDKTQEVKADEVKADKDKTVEVKAVEDAAVKGEGEVADKQEAAGGVAPPDFGLDLLTNLVDEISALGDALQPRPEFMREPADARGAVEEPSAEAAPASTLIVEPEVLQVEPLPFAMRGAPSALEPEASEELYLSLLDDEGDFRAGQLATIKVHVGRGAYGRAPVAGASVTVKVLGTTFRPLILTTDTDERGLAIVRALLPRFTSGRAALIIRAGSGEEFSELRRIIHQ
jgi:hypothetical protein